MANRVGLGVNVIAAFPARYKKEAKSSLCVASKEQATRHGPLIPSVIVCLKSFFFIKYLVGKQVIFFSNVFHKLNIIERSSSRSLHQKKIDIELYFKFNSKSQRNQKCLE